jgi:hypothetical protein
MTKPSAISSQKRFRAEVSKIFLYRQKMLKCSGMHRDELKSREENNREIIEKFDPGVKSRMS